MRVGTREKIADDYASYEDHPHACGDKISYTVLITLSAGSSPCVWGQGQHFIIECVNHRIIPMRVGTRYRIPC